MRLKKRTVRVGDQRQTVELVKLKNRHKDMSRNEWMYVVRDADTKDRLDPPAFTRKEGEKLFNVTLQDIERGMKAAERDRRDDGLLGGFDLGFRGGGLF